MKEEKKDVITGTQCGHEARNARLELPLCVLLPFEGGWLTFEGDATKSVHPFKSWDFGVVPAKKGVEEVSVGQRAWRYTRRLRSGHLGCAVGGRE